MAFPGGFGAPGMGAGGAGGAGATAGMNEQEQAMVKMVRSSPHPTSHHFSLPYSSNRGIDFLHSNRDRKNEQRTQLDVDVACVWKVC
jgi:hypothetical protein